jgi:acyl-CoA thioester hydrolase
MSAQEITLRVYYHDTDAGGVVHHVKYLRFAEKARSDYFRERGNVFWQIMKKHGYIMVARHASIDYFSPAHLSDLLRIVSQVKEVRNSSFVMHSDIYRDDTLLCTVEITLVILNDQFKPQKMSEDLRATLM